MSVMTLSAEEVEFEFDVARVTAHEVWATASSAEVADAMVLMERWAASLSEVGYLMGMRDVYAALVKAGR